MDVLLVGVIEARPDRSQEKRKLTAAGTRKLCKTKQRIVARDLEEDNISGLSIYVREKKEERKKKIKIKIKKGHMSSPTGSKVISECHSRRRVWGLL